MATSCGANMEAGDSSQPMFELTDPLPEKVMFRSGTQYPGDCAQEEPIVVAPVKDEISRTVVKCGTYDEYKDEYTAVEDGGIGCGGFGNVILVRNKSGQEFAAKVVKVGTERGNLRFNRELDAMSRINHPKIVYLYKAFSSNDTAVFVMEYYSGGRLFDRILQERDFQEDVAVVYIKQICEGLEYLHKKNIVHLDLKPENLVCVNHNSRNIKIIDFGMARIVSFRKMIGGRYGTQPYTAPEVLNFEAISRYTDMWSLGVVTYTMLTGVFPFKGHSWYLGSSKRILRVEFKCDEDGWLLTSNAQHFINKLLLKEPFQRMTATEALRHPWLVRHIQTGLAEPVKHWRSNLQTCLGYDRQRPTANVFEDDRTVQYPVMSQINY